ncbi:MAG: hypothetical protein H5U40_15430, partial [Polyangiaceae bacterium]|nr:hypothetical protein [Polyangiaceae bacterium]
MNSPTARHLWMLYGANEHTLRRIAAEAARRGVRPILAGADATTRPIADAYAFDHVVFDLRDPAAADEHLHGVAALCLADPPSSALRTAAIDSCLRTQTHYVDIHPGV